MQFLVEWNGDFFIGTTSGDAVASEFGELLNATLTHEKWEPGTPWLQDHSNLNAGPLTVDAVREIARLCGERRTLIGASKVAIVVGRDLEFGLARMWEVFVDDEWDATAAVFRSREEAIAWLDV